MKILVSVREKYSLSWALIVAVIVKFALFATAMMIIGLFSTRTSLIGCSSASGNAPVYIAPYGDLEAYTDYRDLYLRCLVTPFLHGSGAYNLPIVNNYPPLFVYTLALFGLVNVIWFPAISLLLFDILTVIPVYKITEEFLASGNKKIAFLVSLLWIANPINLFYSDFIWLNPAPTTYFLILSFYFFLKERWLYSSVALAISTGFKQVSIIFFPLLIVLIWKTRGFSKSLLIYILSYVGVLSLISTPYIFQSPQFYFWALSFPILGTPPGYSSSPPTTFVGDLSQPVRLTFFLGLVKYFDLKSFAVTSYGYLDYVFAAAFAILILYVIFSKQKFSKGDWLVFGLATLLIFFALFGRGIYKYYFVTLTPIAIPFYTFKRGALVFVIFSVFLVLAPREVSPWMALLLLTFLPGLIGRGDHPGQAIQETKSEPALS